MIEKDEFQSEKSVFVLDRYGIMSGEDLHIYTDSRDLLQQICHRGCFNTISAIFQMCEQQHQVKF